MNIAVLVGAGASYGGFDDPLVRPPLGSHLFEDLVDQFPESWGNLPSAIAPLFKENPLGFELGMAELWREGRHVQKPLVDMGVYFAQFRLQDRRNRYFDLLRILFSSESNGVVFASLNYETLLEQSLIQMGFAIRYGLPHSDPQNPDRAMVVIKPHGSCNFVSEFVANLGPNSFIDVKGFASYVEGPGAHLIEIELDEVAVMAQRNVPSAMSLYAKGKPDVVCKEHVEEIRAGWSHFVERADLLLIVGARPLIDDDPHIWQPIVNSEAKIGFVGRDQGGELAKAVGDRLEKLGTTFKRGLQRLPEFLQREGAMPEMPPFKKVISKKTIRITNHLESETNFVRDICFKDCVILGPAVLAGNYELIQPAIAGVDTPESFLWKFPKASVVTGSIFAEGCRFERCEFKGVGLAVMEARYDELVATLRASGQLIDNSEESGPRAIEAEAD